jgi:hypothetical protein
VIDRACLAQTFESAEAARPHRPKRALRRGYPHPSPRAPLPLPASGERAGVRGSRKLQPSGVLPTASHAKPASAGRLPLPLCRRLRLPHEEGGGRSRPRLGPAIADLRHARNRRAKPLDAPGGGDAPRSPTSSRRRSGAKRKKLARTAIRGPGPRSLGHEMTRGMPHCAAPRKTARDKGREPTQKARMSIHVDSG